MEAIGKILAIAALAFWLGSAVFFGFTGGPLVGISVLFYPLPALFGWYFFPVVVLFVVLLWCGYTQRLLGFGPRVFFIALGGLVGGITMFVLTRGPGDSLAGEAFVAAGIVSGLLATILITTWKQHEHA